MPKKFGINIKSQEARERKADVKRQKQELKAKLKEDLLWIDDDKHIKAKENRKKEEESKKQREKTRKEKNRKLAERELELLLKNSKSEAPKKKTQAELESRSSEKSSKQLSLEKSSKLIEKELLRNLEKDINPNHALREEQKRLAESNASLVSGSGISEVVSQTNDSKPFKHPEKKMRQAFKRYLSKHMGTAHKEQPFLKGSQILEQLYKSFQKSADNPYNQNHVAYNTKLF